MIRQTKIASRFIICAVANWMPTNDTLMYIQAISKRPFWSLEELLEIKPSLGSGVTKRAWEAANKFIEEPGLLKDKPKE